MLDPDDEFTLHDCGAVDINPVAMQFSEAVAAEVKQNQVRILFSSLEVLKSSGNTMIFG